MNLSSLRWWVEDHARLLLFVFIGLVLVVGGFFAWKLFAASSSQPEPAVSTHPVLSSEDLYSSESPACKDAADNLRALTPFASWQEAVVALRAHQDSCTGGAIDVEIVPNLVDAVAARLPAPQAGQLDQTTCASRAEDLSRRITSAPSLELAAEALDEEQRQCSKLSPQLEEAALRFIGQNLTDGAPRI